MAEFRAGAPGVPVGEEVQAEGVPGLGGRPGGDRRPAVLVVDDDGLVRQMLADILQGEGLTCRTAANGREALAACEAARPDLVLLDVLMPEMDGLETLQCLKATPAWSSIPVVALTSREDPETVVQMLEAGSFLYLVKPVSPPGLVAAVRLALRQH